MSATKNPRFTKRHYEEIHAFTKKILEPENMRRERGEESRSRYIFEEGIRFYHNMLGKHVFFEDNPNFNPELWKLEREVK